MKMDVVDGVQLFGSLFGGQIVLSFGQYFIINYKFVDCCGVQQWWIKVGMKLLVVMVFVVKWCVVLVYGVGE